MEITPITFEQLPNAVNILQETVNDIKQLLLQKENTTYPEPETLLTVQDAAKFLSLSVATIYFLISKGELPVIKRSKRCYFSNIELLEYMKGGRKKTVSEMATEADNFLSSHKKKSGGLQK